MRNQFGLSRLLSSNRFLVVFALLIAVVGWMGVAMNADADQTIPGARVDLDTPGMRLSGLGLSFIGAEEFFVDIEVNGARTVVGNLRPDDFVVSVNVDQATVPDYYNLNVEVTVLNPRTDFQVVGTNPAIIPNVRIDHIDSRMFDVNWDIDGLASAPGYMADTPRLVPSDSVWITGPLAELERIDRVIVPVELEDPLNRPWVQEVPITLLDAAGNEIDLKDTQLVLEHTSLTLQIPVLRIRTLHLVLDIQNMPSSLSESLLRSHMQKTAGTVTIAGPISTMVNYRDWFLGTINLRSLTPENNVFFFDIDMPSEQFINIDNLQAVVVEFDTESWDSISLDIPSEDFIITGDPGGHEISVQTVALNGVTFVGDAETIANLTASDVVVEINLNDRPLIAGPQPHPVRINIPGGELVWPVDEAGNLIVHITATPREE